MFWLLHRLLLIKSKNISLNCDKWGPGTLLVSYKMFLLLTPPLCGYFGKFYKSLYLTKCASGPWEYRWIQDNTEPEHVHTEAVEGGAGGWEGARYTQSGVVGVARRNPSCQFNTGTGMDVSLMVSGQRRDKDGPLSSSRGAWLCTVSTTGSRGVWGMEGGWHRGIRARGWSEDRKDTRTYEGTNMMQCQWSIQYVLSISHKRWSRAP